MSQLHTLTACDMCKKGYPLKNLKETSDYQWMLCAECYEGYEDYLSKTDK